jgi:hypothetical protein
MPTRELDLVFATHEEHHFDVLRLRADKHVHVQGIVPVDLEHPAKDVAAAIGHVRADGDYGPPAVARYQLVEQRHGGSPPIVCRLCAAR